MVPAKTTLSIAVKLWIVEAVGSEDILLQRRLPAVVVKPRPLGVPTNNVELSDAMV
jgi:hypothetical protein